MILAMSFAQVCEEDAGGNERDDGGGLVGLRPDDSRTRSPEEGGDAQDAVKPVGGRCGSGADDARAGRQQSGPQGGEKKPSEQMKAQVLPGSLPERRNAKKDGTVEAESAVEIGEAGNGGVGLDPADAGGAVQTGVVILAGTAAAKSEKECKGDAEEEQPARVLPGGQKASAQLGAAYREPEKADAEEKECDGRSDGENKIPNFKNGDTNGETHPEGVD